MQLPIDKALNLSAAGCPQGHEWDLAQPGVSGCPLYRSTRPVPWGPVWSSRSWQITFITSTLPPSGISRCSLWRSLFILLMGQKGLQRDRGEVWRCDLPRRIRCHAGECQEMPSLWEADLIRFGLALHEWHRTLTLAALEPPSLALHFRILALPLEFGFEIQNSGTTKG